MCGIVGYLGENNSIDVILEGLSRLEYRGYDSAGICIIDPQTAGLSSFRETGKLNNLKKVLAGKNLFSRIGIGHTRWATHGAVTADNAHPHSNELLAIVHNGIIENAGQLREELIAQGEKFYSQTDTETFLVLATRYYKQKMDLRWSVQQAFSHIRGNSAFVVMTAKGDEIVAIKRAAPLVCGQNNVNGDFFVSSDPYALVGFAEDIYFPEDEVICHIQKMTSGSMISFHDLEGKESSSFQKKKSELNADVVEKGEFEHFMLKEIFEQPRLIAQWLDFYVNGPGKEDVLKFQEYKSRTIHIVGCGTAWHAGLVIRDFVEHFNRIHTHVELASEFRYRDPLLKEEEIGLFISQSGETADTLAAEELCRENGLQTFSIVNTVGSTLYRNCVGNFLIRAGQEIGVASTKAFTLQVLTGYLCSRVLSKDFEGHNDLVRDEIKREVELLAERIDLFLKDSEGVKNIAQKIQKHKGFIFTGRRRYYPIALEGALKLKEIAYVHAEGFAAGELKHGPIALIDEDIVNIAIVSPELYEKTVSNVEEVKARNGVIVTIGPKNDAPLKEISDFYIPVDFEGLPNLGPLLVNVVNQVLAYYIALFKGTDIDKPRNLAKSVTVE